MVRTKADPAGVKAAGGKAPRKTSIAPSGKSGRGESKGKQYSGGNSYCPRETPPWQKEITKFFVPKPAGAADDQGSTSSSPEGSPEEAEDIENEKADER